MSCDRHLTISKQKDFNNREDKRWLENQTEEQLTKDLNEE